MHIAVVPRLRCLPSRVRGPLACALLPAILAGAASCGRAEGQPADPEWLRARGVDVLVLTPKKSAQLARADAGAAVPDSGPPETGPLGQEPPGQEPGLSALAGDVLLSEQELWDHLASSPVICLGELHDSLPQHRVEHRVLDVLVERARAAERRLGLGFEMFQRPFQPALDAFVQGQLEEAALLRETEYATRWGYDYAFYRPLLEGARDSGLPALALNARTELVRAVGRGGLAALDAGALAELPELDLNDAEHQAFIYGLLGALPEHAAELGLENIYTAQTIWDETMAETSARWLSGGAEGVQLLIFAGNAHCHESAIPRRIQRRVQRDVLSVAMRFASESTSSEALAGYDLWILLPD